MLPVAQRLDWTSRNLPLTHQAIDRLPRLDGVRIAATVHIDVKFAVAALEMQRRGAELFLATASRHTTRDDVRDHLAQHGIPSSAWRGMSEEDRLDGVRAALEWGPTHTCEMGADISTTAAAEGRTGIVGGLEATQTGINRLEGLALTYPLFNWDHVPIKAGLHNRFAVGRSTWVTFVSTTQLSPAGKHVLVVGFGPVGQGLTEMARALGADVAVADIDPVRRLTARHAGWHVGELDDLVGWADVVVTATGRPGVLDAARLSRLRPGAILVNAGHADDEIELGALGRRTEVIPYVETATVGGTEVYLFAGGAPANITAGFGDTLDSFDVTLAVLVSGVGHLVGEGASARPGVHLLPESAWLPVARAATLR